MGKALVFIIYFMVIFGAGYLFVRYIYGKDPKKRKPLLFTEDVTVKSIFSQNQAKKKSSDSENNI